MTPSSLRRRRSITASLGLLIIGPLMRNYGWSSVWYFLIGCTVVGTLLMTPKILKEMRQGTVTGTYKSVLTKV